MAAEPIVSWLKQLVLRVRRFAILEKCQSVSDGVAERAAGRLGGDQRGEGSVAHIVSRLTFTPAFSNWANLRSTFRLLLPIIL